MDDKHNPIEQINIGDIVNRWKARGHERDRKRTDQSFLVPVSEIEANNWDLSMNRFKEIVYEAVEYDTPEEIINGKTVYPGLKELMEQNRKDLEVLETLLKH